MPKRLSLLLPALMISLMLCACGSTASSTGGVSSAGNSDSPDPTLLVICTDADSYIDPDVGPDYEVLCELCGLDAADYLRQSWVKASEYDTESHIAVRVLEDFVSNGTASQYPGLSAVVLCGTSDSITTAENLSHRFSDITIVGMESDLYADAVGYTAPLEDAAPSLTAMNLDRFLASESTADGFYLGRNGSLYSLNMCSYGNRLSASLGGNRILYLRESDEVVSNVTTVERYPADIKLVSVSEDASIPSFESGDNVRYYSKSSPVDLDLIRAEFTGYTIAVEPSDTNSFATYGDPNDSSTTSHVIRDTSKLTLTDRAGKEHDLDERFNFEKGEQVTVSWYEGTQYREVKLAAEYPCYRIDPSIPTETLSHTDYVNKQNLICLPGTLGKNGYATYDMSSVPAGLYMTPTGGLIQITG